MGSTFEMQVDAVAAYLSKGLGAPVAVFKLRQTFPGASRETWLVDAEVAGRPEGFVVRVDCPGGPGVPQSMRHEWEVYTRLWRSTIPVAEPLWYDEGIDFAQGRPHMIRRLVEGSTHIPGLTDDTDEGRRLRRAVVFEHVEKLAALHRMDWAAHGFGEFIPAPASPAQALRNEFDIWKTLWLEGRSEPFPMMTEVLYWLEENIPADTPFVSLVKGNNGVGEEIWKDGRIVAMSDWELASLGDGVLDIAFSQGTLALDDFGDAIRHYEECTGTEVSPHRLAFCMFWIMFKAVACLNIYMLGGYLGGANPRMTRPAFGLISVRASQRRLAACIGKDPVDAWRAIAGHQASTYARFGGRK
ncbi:MAG: phosphotransferase [Alphaproteobacteria bacterium]|nr:phosphotransferase [Alphaproteobacteria bacterium]